MKALIYLYDDYAEFEISILDTILRGSGGDVVTCSHLPKGDFVVSSGGLASETFFIINRMASYPKEDEGVLLE